MDFSMGAVFIFTARYPTTVRSRSTPRTAGRCDRQVVACERLTFSCSFFDPWVRRQVCCYATLPKRPYKSPVLAFEVCWGTCLFVPSKPQHGANRRDTCAPVPTGSMFPIPYAVWELTALSSLISTSSMIRLPLLLRKSPMIPRFSSSFLCRRIFFEMILSENLSSL